MDKIKDFFYTKEKVLSSFLKTKKPALMLTVGVFIVNLF